MNSRGNHRGMVFLAALLAGAMGAFSQIPPVTISTTSPLPAGYVGVPYQLTFSATTNPPNQTVVWSIARGSANPPSGITLSSTGSFSGTPAAGSTGSYTFTVQAQLSNPTAVISTTQTFTMNILASQITVVTPATLPAGLIGQPYSQTLQATSIPNLGITWSPAVPVANLGLTLSPGGVLSGTPNLVCSPCVVPITAQITGTNVAVTTNFSLSIVQGQVLITTTTLPLASVGQRYSAQLTATPSGSAWSLVGGVGSLPPGIALTAAGVLSGIPTIAGAYPLTLQAAFPGDQSAQSTINLYVTNGPLAIVQTSIPVAIQNAPYQTTLTGTGGLPPYQWSTSNTLGMTIGATSGTITGTAATLGPQTLLVTLSDSTGATFTEALPLFVAAPLSVLTASLPNGAIGSSYSQNLQAGGGQAPYAWTLVQGSGSPPPGLSLSPSGSLSGVPTANGAYSFTVQVTDAGQRVATKALSITVAGSALTITTPSLPNAPAGVVYSQTLAAAGGTPPYTWAILSGSLPAGLSLDPKSGTLSGTPSGSPATSAFTVQVTDSTPGPAPLTAQKAFTLNITAPALTITTTSPLPNGSVGVSYAQTLQASAGTPPYTWSLASGSLPPGLTLNPTTGAISGTPTTAGPFAFVVVATDSSGQTVQKSLAITITPALTLTTGNLSGTAGSTFMQGLVASGGTSPYTFSLTGGTLPAGLAVAPNGSISGTPTAAGTFTVTFTVTDANKQTASATITITVSQAALPPITFTVGTGSQPPVTLCLGGAFPGVVNGTLTASFAPSSSVSVGTDQSIQLISVGSLQGTGPTLSFSVPACGTTPPISATVTMGTVAGTITITPTLSANGVTVTPSNLTPQTITIPAAPPVIQSVMLTPGTGSTTVSVIGYSSTREVIGGQFTFAPATGSTLSQTAITVQLGSAFTTWYQGSASDAFGSLFQLTVPFTVSGSALDVVAVTVTLTNTKGTSAAVTSQ